MLDHDEQQNTDKLHDVDGSNVQDNDPTDSSVIVDLSSVNQTIATRCSRMPYAVCAS